MKLLIGGSPCTHWSIAQTKNRETKAEGIGWELFRNYVIARDKYQPDYFLYENNKSMSTAIREQITAELGVEPVLINSALVSAQNRQRLYWVGKRNPDGTYSQVPVEQPEDRGILLRDILESGVAWREKSYALLSTTGGTTANDMIAHRQRNGAAEPVNTTAEGKAKCLRASAYKDGIRNLVGNDVDKRTCVAEPIILNPCRSGKSRTVHAGMCRLENNLIPRINNLRPEKQQYDCIVEEIPLSPSTQISATVPAGMARRGRENGSAFEVRDDQKSNAISAVGHQSRLVVEATAKKSPTVYEVRDGKIRIGDKEYPIKLRDGCYIIRKLTVAECRRLQTVPGSYDFPVSDSQAYKMLGNGWTVDVIAHLLSHFEGLTEEPVEVLSMYDGMSCGHIALDKLGVDVAAYYTTEIDKYAIQTTQHNYPETIQLGDAFQVRDPGWVLPREAST